MRARIERRRMDVEVMKMGERKMKVGGIMANGGLAAVSILSLPDRPDVLGNLLLTMGARNINIEFVVYGIDLKTNGNLTFCVSQKDLGTVSGVLEGVKSVMGMKEVSYHSDVAVISVFGPHFREKPMISGLMFSALGTSGVKVLAISTSISSCSCLVRADQAKEAVKALHETFEAPHQITKFDP